VVLFRNDSKTRPTLLVLCDARPAYQVSISLWKIGALALLAIVPMLLGTVLGWMGRGARPSVAALVDDVAVVVDHYLFPSRRAVSLDPVNVPVGYGGTPWPAVGPGGTAESDEVGQLLWASYSFTSTGIARGAGFQTSARARQALQRAADLGLGTRHVAWELFQGRVRPEWTGGFGRDSAFPGTLRWPVEGGVFVRGFGAGATGHHQAVDIAAAPSTPIRAAAEGLVAYAGRVLRGYGNTVLVVHRGGWVTLYAHNEQNLAIPGEYVSRGDVIATVGNTGISRGPHLHFELMVNGAVCDPLALMQRSGRRANAGHRPRAVWKYPGQRPTTVRCQRRRQHPLSRWAPPLMAQASPGPSAEGERK
jgi:hypothetical protein